ncbi:MAG: hypothetical protein QM660_05640 [Dysgonomonas sp.]
MKSRIYHIAILITAIAVFFTGTGVTVMNYCCSGCVSEFLSFNTQSCTCSAQHESETHMGGTCCSVSMEHEDMQHSDCNENIVATSNHCSSSRLSIDLDASMFRPHVATPFVWLSTLGDNTSYLLPRIIEYADAEDYVDDPPTMQPRSYLSLIRVLII